MRRKSNKYSINKKAADATLQNVFAACDQNPNDTPLEVIRAISIANAAVVKIGMIASIVLLCLVLLSPLVFLNSEKNAHLRASENNVKVTGHYMDNESKCFVMCLSGEGIIYDEIYALTNDGIMVRPSKIDEKSGMVFIPFREGNLNIYVPSEDGKCLQAVLSK